MHRVRAYRYDLCKLFRLRSTTPPPHPLPGESCAARPRSSRRNIVWGGGAGEGAVNIVPGGGVGEGMAGRQPRGTPSKVGLEDTGRGGVHRCGPAEIVATRSDKHTGRHGPPQRHSIHRRARPVICVRTDICQGPMQNRRAARVSLPSFMRQRNFGMAPPLGAS